MQTLLRILLFITIISMFQTQPANAAPPAFVDPGNGTIIDTANNLTWLKNANCFGAINWYDAMDRSNNLASGQCGLTDNSKAGDWHLPTIDELRIFTDNGYLYNSLNSSGFESVQAYLYWSSSTYASSTYVAWGVSMVDGLVFYFSKYYELYVWPVRSGQFWPFDSLIISKNSAPRYFWVGTPNLTEFFIRNGGVAASTFSAQITGTDNDQFIVAPGGSAPCAGLAPTLEANDFCTMLITATPTSRGTKNASLTITNISGSKDFPLGGDAYTSVYGTVTDQSTGLAVAGATIALNTGATATSAADGSYSLGQLPDGTYSITVAKSGYQSVAKASLTVTTINSARADILLSSTSPLNITTNQLPSATAGELYQSRVMLGGGRLPYTFSKAYGTLPSGLTIDVGSGVISGTPTGSGIYTFAVGVSDGASGYSEREYTIEMTPAFVITTASIPTHVTSGTAYNAAISATGGKPSYTFSVTAGTLPAGLALSTDGVISGTLSATGYKNFTIAASDSTDRTISRPYSIWVDAPLTITTATINTGLISTPYSQQLTASGGAGVKQWRLTAGVLPQGITLDQTTGLLSGTPTEAVSRAITISVSDGYGRTTSQNYQLSVANQLSFSSNRLPNAHANSTYSERILVSGGVPPYTFALSGTLPSGLSLDTATGIISGTASVSGLSNLGITVTDSSLPTPASLAATIPLRVTGMLTPVTSATLPEALKQQSYSATLAAAGGTSPYAWDITSGALPPGLTLNASTGTINGIPTASGDYSFTVRLSDTAGITTGDSINPDKTYYLHVGAFNPLFTGSNYLAMPDNTIKQSTTLTFEAWFKTSSSGVILGYQDAVVGNSVASHVPALYVGSDGKLYGEYWMDSMIPLSSSKRVDDSVWHHAALVGNAATQVLYLDGELVGTLDGLINPENMSINQVGVGAGEYWPGLVGGWTYFNGMIDDIRVWNSARSQTEIQNSMNSQLTGTESGLLFFKSSGSSRTILPVSIDKVGSGTGNVTVDNGAITWNANHGTIGVAPSTSMILAATPDAGYVFNGWGGDCGGTGYCTITVDTGKNITASFERQWTITVNKTGSGNGTINPNSGSLTWNSNSGAGLFVNGTSVTLTAVPDTGYVFTGWSGTACSGLEPCIVLVTDNKNITAGFSPATTLNVTFSGTGGGSINSNPAGISCVKGISAGCSYGFATASNVTLIPATNITSTFDGWSNACSNKTGNCVVAMNAVRTATATFTAAPKVKVGIKDYPGIQAAYDNADTLNNSVIKLLEGYLPGTFTAGRNSTVSLEGGYNAVYSHVNTETAIQSPLVITSGAVIINGISVR